MKWLNAGSVVEAAGGGEAVAVAGDADDAMEAQLVETMVRSASPTRMTMWHAAAQVVSVHHQYYERRCSAPAVNSVVHS